jgi:hypothetical protein
MGQRQVVGKSVVIPVAGGAGYLFVPAETGIEKQLFPKGRGLGIIRIPVGRICRKGLQGTDP